MRIAICPNPEKRPALQCAQEAIRILRQHGAEIVMNEELRGFAEESDISYLPAESLFAGCDFAVSIGGDGTILRCAGMILEQAAAAGTEPVRLVGINTGTLGFLAAFEADELQMLPRLFTGDYAISRRMLLRTAVNDGSGLVRHALNDIYASRLNGRICDFSVAVDGRTIGIYRADGIVFSTPTGSTAYALSAGGPVMEPDLSLIEMNLICPHSLFARPMLFAPQREICVTYCGVGDGGLNVHADGVHTAVLHNHQSFTVTVSERVMPFVDCKGYAFYDALNGKLMSPLKSINQNGL